MYPYFPSTATWPNMRVYDSRRRGFSNVVPVSVVVAVNLRSRHERDSKDRKVISGTFDRILRRCPCVCVYFVVVCICRIGREIP